MNDFLHFEGLPEIKFFLAKIQIFFCSLAPTPFPTKVDQTKLYYFLKFEIVLNEYTSTTAQRIEKIIRMNFPDAIPNDATFQITSVNQNGTKKPNSFCYFQKI